MTNLTRNTRGLNDLQREIDRVFGRFFSPQNRKDNSNTSRPVWAPRMDLLETDEAFRIRLDVPGTSKEDVAISYEDNQLTVRGSRPTRSEDGEEYIRAERPSGPFYRSFSLPESVNADEIHATQEEGVLTIFVPKSETVKPRQIEIQ